MTPKQKRLKKLRDSQNLKSFGYYLLGALATAVILIMIGVFYD